MTPLLAFFFAGWLIAAGALMLADAGGHGRLPLAWALVGLVPVLIAAEQGAWHLGEWSRDLTPLPVFGAVVLATVAIERALPPREQTAGMPAGPRRPVANWLRGSIVASGLALGLLGDSGLALTFTAAIAAVLAFVAGTEARSRPDLRYKDE